MSTDAPPSRADFERLDQDDPLRDRRDRFQLPEGCIYLDGNSLGPLPKGLADRLARTVEQDWGRGLVSSWNDAGWIDLPTTIGDRLAGLIGAESGEVAVGDSTSVNIFKLASALLTADGGRRAIVTEADNFPTDIYVLEGLVNLFGGRHRLVLAEPDRIAEVIDEDTALAVLTHVNYRTGRMLDMASLTRRAAACGAPLIWDLCHSAGAVPLDLKGCGVSYAVGCTYKYLNGGPGAPAYVYIARDKIGAFRPSLTGWFGHARQFAFEPAYEADESIRKALVGTPPVLSLVALDAALDVWEGVDPMAVRRKSVALAEHFIALVEPLYRDHGLRLVSPRAGAERGSQVSLAHPAGYPIMQALIARGVVGDFRAPDILRFGFAPLFIRYVDVYDATAHLRQVLESGEWRRPEFGVRRAVT